MPRKESDLKKLKEDYKKLQEKYDLPSFKELNEDFQIEKITEIETELLIKEVRKFMADKLSNYLRFIETLLNPINAPMFIFSIIKAIGIEEKKKITEIYKKLSKIEIGLIEVDIDFSEKKEAVFIKESYKTWQEIKRNLLEIIDIAKKNWDSKIEPNNKGYFG